MVGRDGIMVGRDGIVVGRDGIVFSSIRRHSRLCSFRLEPEGTTMPQAFL
jgi:hypothetical protein